MDDERNCLLWPWIVIGLLPVLYVLSFGPARWIVSRADDNMVPSFYMPIGFVDLYGPKLIRRQVDGYARLGMLPESVILVPSCLAGNPIVIFNK